MHPVAIVPAAGKGERFGGAKLLARIGEDTLLDRTLRSLIDGGVESIVLVTAPGADLSVVSAMKDPHIRLVVNADPARGMFSSIQQGLREAATGDPLLVLPADMPFVTSYVISGIIAMCALTQRIVVPVYRGKRGHPVAFRSSLRDALLAADAQSTLKAALTATGTPHFDMQIEDPGVLRDVDVPQDLS